MKLHSSAFSRFSLLLMKGTMGGPQCETLTRCIKETLPAAFSVDFLL